MDLHRGLSSLVFVWILLLAGFARGRAIIGFMLHCADHRDFPRTHDLLDAERAHQIDERLDLVGVAGHLDGYREIDDVDHVTAKGGDDRVELGPRALVHRHLHHHHLAVDSTDVLEVGDLDHRDQLVELLVYLFEDLVIARRHQHDARDGGIERILVDGQRLDIEAAAGEQAGHASEHTELVFDQYGYRMAWHRLRLRPGRPARREPSAPLADGDEGAP